MRVLPSAADAAALLVAAAAVALAAAAAVALAAAAAVALAAALAVRGAFGGRFGSREEDLRR